MRLATAAVLLATLAAPRATFADDEARANALVEEGNQLGAVGKLEEAIIKFKQAEALFPRALHDCNIGLAYVRLQRWSKAHLFLSRCSQRWPATDGAEPEWLRANLQGVLGQLESGPFARLSVSTSPPGGIVEVDGERLFAPDLWLTTGSHRLTARKDGYHQASTDLPLSKGENKRLVIPLEQVEEADPLATPVPRETTTTTPEVIPQQIAEVERDTQSSSTQSSSRFWWTVGASSLTLSIGMSLAGVLFHTRASDARDDLVALNTQAREDYESRGAVSATFDDEFAETKDRLDRNNLLMGTSLIAAAVLAGAGGYAIFRAIDTGKGGAARTSITAASDHVGAIASWSF